MKKKILNVITICLVILSVIVSAVSCDEASDSTETSKNPFEWGTSSPPESTQADTDETTSPEGTTSAETEPPAPVDEYTALEAAEYLNGKNEIFYSMICRILESAEEGLTDDTLTSVADRKMQFTVNKKGALLSGLDSIVVTDGSYMISGSRTSDSGKAEPYKLYMLNYEKGSASFGTEGGKTHAYSYGLFEETAYVFDTSKIEKAQTIDKAHLTETETDGEFELSRNYYLNLIGAIESSVKLNGENAFEIAKNLPDTSKIHIFVDIREYEKDILYVSIKDETTSVRLKIDFSELDGDSGKVTGTTESSEGFEATIEFSLTIENKEITDLKILVDASDEEKAIRFSLALGAEGFGFDIELKENGNTVMLVALALSGTADDQTLKFNVKANEKYSEELQNGGAGVTLPLPGNGENVSVLDISGELRMVYKNDEPISVTLNCKGNADGTVFELSLTADSEKEKIKGENAILCTLTLTDAQGRKASYKIALVTEKYESEVEATYILTVSGTELEGKTNEEKATLKLSESITFPLSTEEAAMKKRFDVFFGDTERAINNLNTYADHLERLYKNGDKKYNYDKFYYYVTDKQGQFYYVFDTEKKNNTVYCSARISFDPSELHYFYTECNEGMLEVRYSDYFNDVEEMRYADRKSFIEYSVHNDNIKWVVYRYVKEIDAYLAVGPGTNYIEVFDHDPAAELSAQGKGVHQMTYDKSGNPVIHNFVESYDDKCYHYYRCKGCGYSYKSKNPIHNSKSPVVLRKLSSANSKAIFSICDRCKQAEIVLEYSQGTKIIFKCEKVSLNVMNKIAAAIGEKPYTAEQIKNYLVITEMDFTYGPNEKNYNFDSNLVEIPDISSTGYVLVGIDGYSRDNIAVYNLKLKLPEKMLFVRNGLLGANSYLDPTVWKEIVFPSSMRYIGKIGLLHETRELTIPENVAYFAGFIRAKNLETLTIKSKHLEYLEYGYVPALNTIVFDGTIKEFGGIEKEDLTELVIPEGCEIVSGMTDSIALQRVVLPETVTTIKDAAFRGCTSLKEIVLPASVRYIGDQAFKNCTSLEKVDFKGTKLDFVGESAFEGCKAIVELKVPVISECGYGIFENCSSLKSAELLGGYEVIPLRMFSGCSRLEKIILPKGVKEIGYLAFAGTIITEIDLPESLEKIGSSAFYACKRLESIDFPEKLSYIGESAFANCEKLYFEELIFGDTIKYIEKNAFSGIRGAARLVFNPGIESTATKIISGKEFGDVYYNCPSLRMESLGGISKSVTYAKGCYWKGLTCGEVINIESEYLATGLNFGNIVTIIYKGVKEVNFAGTREIWEAGLMKPESDSTVVNFNVKFN